MTSTTPDPVQIERSGRVMTVRLVNPPHNFMNREMVLGLEQVITGLERDDSIGAVIVTGGDEGKFITHYDVAEILAGAEGLGQEVGPRLAGATLAAAGPPSSSSRNEAKSGKRNAPPSSIPMA